MKILVVCMGNICRSPLAQGIFEHKIKNKKLNWTVDSAGTGGWHKGEKPDARAIKEAAKNNINIGQQKARQIQEDDFENFDSILVMDADNFNEVIRLSKKPEHKAKIQFMTNAIYPNKNIAVPDPYYNGKFTEAFELLEMAIEKFIEVNTKK